MNIKHITREEFVSAITTDKGDRFAKTFVSKADLQDLWSTGYVRGMFNYEGQLLGAIITTQSKREPRVTNLQLLHTFVAHRGKGVGKELVKQALIKAFMTYSSYFRVSAEKDAVEFYKKCGFEFAGRQKSGCQLSIFRLEDDGKNIIGKMVYDYADPVIRAAVFRKGKGGCVEIFFEDPVQTLESV